MWLVLPLLLAGGCRSGPRPWPEPALAMPMPPMTATASASTWDAPLERAERAYHAASRASRKGTPDAVEHAHQALAASYAAWSEASPGECQSAASPDGGRARVLYDSSLSLLLREAQRHGRWDPRTGILLHLPEGSRILPVRYHGFAWSSDDFCQLELIGHYPTEGLNGVRRRAGWGVPLVVVRRRVEEERFFDSVQPFSATAVWRPASVEFTVTGESGSEVDTEPPAEDLDALLAAAASSSGTGVLELVDPGQAGRASLDADQYPLAADFSAPFAWARLREPRRPRLGFLQPDSGVQEHKLFMLQPHRAGRVPVVFVHGLLSDPTTWIAAANELWSQPWFRERYEIWGFRYPTGDPFLTSAARFREELRVLHNHLQSVRPDPALDRMVLVGHSMGGLICKLQICSSGGDTLWRSIACRDLDEIRAEPWQRERLRRLFFFEPQPFVDRVVFIGTPHGGSAYANRLVGRIASSLVERDRERVAAHCRLITENPGVFAPVMRRRMPTSIDLLEPDSPLLQTIRRLPIRQGVALHSVIGTGGCSCLGPPSDGVVPVPSARHAGVVDELYVDERHQDLQQHPLTIQFLEDTLRLSESASRHGTRLRAPSRHLPQPKTCREGPPEKTVDEA